MHAYFIVSIFILIVVVAFQSNTINVLGLANETKTEALPSTNPTLIKFLDDNKLNDNVITALSTLGGAVIGAFATLFTTREIEKTRVNKERETQRELRVNIRTFVRQEMESYLAFLNSVKRLSSPLMHNGQVINGEFFVNDNEVNEILNHREGLTKDYITLDFDKKMLAFGAESYLTITKAYREFWKFQLVEKPGHRGCFTSHIDTIMESIERAKNTLPS